MKKIPKYHVFLEGFNESQSHFFLMDLRYEIEDVGIICLIKLKSGIKTKEKGKNISYKVK